MRAFVAIDLPEDVADALISLRDRLPAGKPVDPDTLHLTLAFLGEQPDEVMEEVHLALSALRLSAFDLMLSGLGTFGAKQPAVLYAGIAETPNLYDLQARVATASRRSGIELDRRRFRPHVTLARFRRRVSGVELERLRTLLETQAGLRLGPFPVVTFALYRSTLMRGGPLHEELARYPLEAAAG